MSSVFRLHYYCKLNYIHILIKVLLFYRKEDILMTDEEMKRSKELEAKESKTPEEEAELEALAAKRI